MAGDDFMFGLDRSTGIGIIVIFAVLALVVVIAVLFICYRLGLSRGEAEYKRLDLTAVDTPKKEKAQLEVVECDENEGHEEMPSTSTAVCTLSPTEERAEPKHATDNTRPQAQSPTAPPQAGTSSEDVLLVQNKNKKNYKSLLTLPKFPTKRELSIYSNASSNSLSLPVTKRPESLQSSRRSDSSQTTCIAVSPLDNDSRGSSSLSQRSKPSRPSSAATNVEGYPYSENMEMRIKEMERDYDPQKKLFRGSSALSSHRRSPGPLLSPSSKKGGDSRASSASSYSRGPRSSSAGSYRAGDMMLTGLGGGTPTPPGREGSSQSGFIHSRPNSGQRSSECGASEDITDVSEA